jgi:type I restriction enzyme R subunit
LSSDFLTYHHEQLARQQIDKSLHAAGWIIQDKSAINFAAGPGIAVREYQTDIGPADYILFVDKVPMGVIEAKREDEGHKLTVHEQQSHEYATAKLKWFRDNNPLPFVYESTGTLTHFTDYRDPAPRARMVFAFHRPETLREWYGQAETLRSRLKHATSLPAENLRDCQFRAITKLEASFAENKPRALIQMATGAGKTFTAITFIYRLLRFAKAKRILFLVDTKNLGEQAETEFMAYTPTDDQRKFTELYNVQRLKSSVIDKDAQVCISTIQRMYSILKGEELDERAEETSLNELSEQSAPKEVAYNPNIPIEFFDFIVIDECHRSIYNLWKQVLDYYDAYLIGLTATPDKRTFGFFNENVVSEYTHEDAVADGVNVGYEVFTIETTITKQGAKIEAKEFVDKREKLSRRKRWEQLDEELEYSGKDLDRDVVNPSTIRNIIRTFKEKLLVEIFPGRKEVPKTLIFAKTDSHADDIIQIVREEFGEGNDFCRKITYQEDKPREILQNFRNEYNPRIAVTVDMIATGTDVKAIECLIFMRDVRSRNYFEQMKGRGTRTLSGDELKKRTPSANTAKTHFVIIDAVGVCKTVKTDSRPMERKPSVSLKDLLHFVMMGDKDEDTMLSVGNRLNRLEKEMTAAEKEKFKDLSGGKTINQLIHQCWDAFNPDVIEEKAKSSFPVLREGGLPEGQDGRVKEAELLAEAQNQLINEAASTLSGPLIDYIIKVRQTHDQIIDSINIDTIEFAGWDGAAKDNAENMVRDFNAYLSEHKDEITALSIYYNQPYKRREVTFQMIKDLLDKLRLDRPVLAPMRVWHAYERLDQVSGQHPINELTALVSLIRRASGIDPIITLYESTVNRNFQKWILRQNAGQHNRFSEEQMDWLRMIKDFISNSVHIQKDDIEHLSPFVDKGGLLRFYTLFGQDYENLINELNEQLVA